MLARSASMTAVSGSARMNGCSTVGKALRGEEDAGQDPHRQHHEVHQARRRLDGLRARRDQQSQGAEHRRRPEGTAAAGAHREPRSGTPKTSTAKPTRTTTSSTSNSEPREQERQQVFGARHRRRPPGASAVSCGARPRWRIRCPRCRCPSGSCRAVRGPGSRCSGARPRGPGRRSMAPGRCGRRRVAGRGRRACGAARPSGLVSSYGRRRGRPGPAATTSATVPVRSASLAAAAVRQPRRRAAFFGVSAPATPAPLTAAILITSAGWLRKAMPEPGGQQDREDEGPEDRLRLAQELAEAHQGQLRSRRTVGATHRAGASR